MQSSSSDTALLAGGPAPEDSRTRVAAVAEGATTQSTTSSTIRVVETEEKSNIEEVAEIMLQEARAQAAEVVYAGWLDDAAKGTPEDPAADRSSEDATITASRIMWSMAATTVIEKEQHHSTSDGWRSMTTWNEHETDKCWEDVKSILTGELDIGVPTTYVSENHGYVHENRGPIFPQVAAMQSRMRPDAFGWHIPTQRSRHKSDQRGTMER